MHLTLEPTWWARSLSCAAMRIAANGARATATNKTAEQSGRDLVITFTQSYAGWHRQRRLRHGLACIRQHHHGAAIRQQRHERAEHDDYTAKPNPFHQGVQKYVNDGNAGFRTDTGK